ncbi:MAG: methyltransferase domain-containing protein [Zetaproteobacteria bacterium]|nr:methyltransferase domain-containing protein [Zetaproteobacteria bacterium]
MSELRLRYQTVEFNHHDIHVRSLRDNQQFSDPMGIAEDLGISSAQWPLFGVLWDSGVVLAHFMDNYDTHNKRVLEVGCGIGLSSLLLNQRHDDISATDYHPDAAVFLQANTELNHGRDIPFERNDWAEDDSTLGTFDLIIGSDLLYEVEHIPLLSTFINRHANTHCDVIVVDPGRGNHAKFSKAMVALGYRHSQHKPDGFSGQIIQFHRSASS